ncbi:hypothetical protein MRB53_041704 [Persea americana]|nr:hypothetical protein MRB53_041704 [Persea americana]
MVNQFASSESLVSVSTTQLSWKLGEISYVGIRVRGHIESTALLSSDIFASNITSTGLHNSEMQDTNAEARQSHRTLAPRAFTAHSDTQDTTQRDVALSAEPSRRARLTHRSRAGCYTCRHRKVKCDEQRPRCGFNDATTSTKQRNTNVTTSGNAVWDPNARLHRRPSLISPSHDNLPEFTVLTNDDERERKAETNLPGTYNVVATPDSFADLPEYGGVTTPMSRRNSRTLRLRVDTNTVFLDRFEESTPTSALPSGSSILRRASFPVINDSTSTHTTSASRSATLPPGSSYVTGDISPLMCFREHIMARLVPNSLHGSSILGTPSGTLQQEFELESARYPPLQDAMQALGALHLYYAQRAELETASEHYARALSAQSSFTEHDLISNGVFLRHFLLYVYDLSMQPSSDPTETDMWAVHLTQLSTLAIERAKHKPDERFGYVLWMICRFDLEACLLGHGDCDFLHKLSQHNIIPHILQQVPFALPSPASMIWRRELTDLPALLELNQAMVVGMAKMARTAYNCRSWISDQGSTVQLLSHCQSLAQQIEDELLSTWASLCPVNLDNNPLLAMTQLAQPMRYALEAAFQMLNTAILYSRTSMYQEQRIFTYQQTHESTTADNERRISAILELASSLIAAKQYERRLIIFPIFIAGTATRQSDNKIRSLELIRAFERSGIGQNTRTVRRLLNLVFEEQSEAVRLGNLAESVEWMEVSKSRGLHISNCGL